MWPMKLDYTPEECRGILRQLGNYICGKQEKK